MKGCGRGLWVFLSGKHHLFSVARTGRQCGGDNAAQAYRAQVPYDLEWWSLHVLYKQWGATECLWFWVGHDWSVWGLTKVTLTALSRMVCTNCKCRTKWSMVEVVALVRTENWIVTQKHHGPIRWNILGTRKMTNNKITTPNGSGSGKTLILVYTLCCCFYSLCGHWLQISGEGGLTSEGPGQGGSTPRVSAVHCPWRHVRKGRRKWRRIWGARHGSLFMPSGGQCTGWLLTFCLKNTHIGHGGTCHPSTQEAR
jgi:hypothetical protein